jgi:dTDP-4-dehydrorhamnose reductase
MNRDLEIWTGIEATVNRVADGYFDQLEYSGHANRLEDLDLLPTLGISAIRYPILWERFAPDEEKSIDWSWADKRLSTLKELGIRPIVGLTHHGSGPKYTSLLDPQYAKKLAAYARLVAERYPWVEDYTPVNEPLTTARFSALYGHWYPHKKDDKSFMTALLNQIDGIKLAMKAIREVNPKARLIQTEDLGKIHSTKKLAYQADFENERRFFTYDLLCGQFHPSQDMLTFLKRIGLSEKNLNTYNDSPTPPDIIGLNYYITSQRFLDHRISLYPPSMHGGNGKHTYVDVETVRVAKENIEGLSALLSEVWKRYKIPLAITEAHLGCTREEQIRWLAEIWNTVQTAKKDNIDIRALTPWALFGLYDWDSLVTKKNNHYESGIYDLRSSSPRPTALVTMIKQLSAIKTFDHPVLDTEGWWHRPDRLIYKSTNRLQTQEKTALYSPPSTPHIKRKLLIIGATGTLGKACARICDMRGIPYVLLSRPDIDITNLTSIRNVLDEHKPWAIINTAGYVKIDDAEREQELCRQINTVGPQNLALAAAEKKIQFVTFSSDMVFDGTINQPYKENDTVSPLNVYGRTKSEAEKLVQQIMPEALIVRTSAFFGPWDQYNFITNAIQTIKKGETFTAANDYTVSPTYIPDLVNVFLDLLIDSDSGIIHMVNNGSVTWADFAKQALKLYQLDEKLFRGKPLQTFRFKAARPQYSVLESHRGLILPTLEEALYKYKKESEIV